MKIKIQLFTLALVATLVSCNDFLDINKDPNNPTQAQLNTILPFVEANIFGAYGIGTAGISEILSVYVHQTVQRGNQDDYKVQGNEFSLRECWDHTYTVILTDLNQLIKQGDEEGRFVYSGIAKVLKAQVFSLAVDLWGDIPYSEAGDPTQFLFPHFDDDASVYASLFALVDEGIADLNAGGVPPGSDDIVYAGNIGKWLAYANSLKLNMYNKVRHTGLYDAAKVNALMAGDLISNASGDFEFRYNTSITPENRNPGFIREYAQGDPQYYISPYFYYLMKGEQACQNTRMVGISDPRMPYYFYNQLNDSEEPQANFSLRDGNFLSIWFGSFDRDPNEGFGQNISQTVVGLYPVGGAYDNGSGATATGDSGLKGAGAQRIMTAADVDFIRAELVLTAGANGNAEALFRNAMLKAFAKVNLVATSAGAPLISDTDRDTYIDAVMAAYQAGSDAEKLELLMTQKWIQAFGFAIESYNDIRRTGYPQVCDPFQDANEYSIQTNPYPVSLFYSTNDITNNRNSPGQRNPYTDKVFWDAN